MITHSAIEYNEIIYTGQRHDLIIKDMVENHNIPAPIKGKQGFIDHDGNFLNRNEAYIEAEKCNQLKENCKDIRALYSEYLIGII